MTQDESDPTRFFWQLVKPYQKLPDVEKGIIFGCPCLYRNKKFFASCERDTGHLLVKVNEELVNEFIDQGMAEAFAPLGKVFKEWMILPNRDEELWLEMIEIAYQQQSGA